MRSRLLEASEKRSMATTASPLYFSPIAALESRRARSRARSRAPNTREFLDLDSVDDVWVSGFMHQHGQRFDLGYLSG